MYTVKKKFKGLVMNNSGPCPNCLYLPENHFDSKSCFWYLS